VAGIFWYKAQRQSFISTTHSLVAYANQYMANGMREQAALLARQAYFLNRQYQGNLNVQIAAALRLSLVMPDGEADVLVEQVCHKATRNLTLAEWQQVAGAIIPYNPCPGLTAPGEAGFVPRLRRAPLTTNEIRALSLNLRVDGGVGYPVTDIANAFKDRGDVVVDDATGLMWQKSGSADALTYADAQAYITQLNDQKFAGYSDWRLPTIEELLSLLELKRQSNDLYINPMFDAKQPYVWSMDTRIKDENQSESSSGAAWDVSFDYGHVHWDGLDDDYSVRAVRS